MNSYFERIWILLKGRPRLNVIHYHRWNTKWTQRIVLEALKFTLFYFFPKNCSFFFFYFYFFSIFPAGWNCHDMLGLFSHCVMWCHPIGVCIAVLYSLGYVKPVAWISFFVSRDQGKKWAFVTKAQVYTTYAPNTHTYCHYVKIKESELLQKFLYRNSSL